MVTVVTVTKRYLERDFDNRKLAFLELYPVRYILTVKIIFPIKIQYIESKKKAHKTVKPDIYTIRLEKKNTIQKNNCTLQKLNWQINKVMTILCLNFNLVYNLSCCTF
jgi:hypothetical protein